MSKVAPVAGFSAATAAAVVVANMIGTGVFTSLGFQLVTLNTGFALIALWVVGGLTALCGALTYAELGAALPRSGGEYNFLSEVYHPAAGFTSGWVSFTVGFAAPVALAAITFGTYLSSIFPTLAATPLALGLVGVLTVIHANSRRHSGGVQRSFTVLKIALIVLFCLAAALSLEAPQPVNFWPTLDAGSEVFSAAFAVSLIYVNYAYTGWNAATYLTSELENPQRDLPRILAFGTAIVALLYVALNVTFLLVAPAEAMVGKVEVGYIAAQSVFGPVGATIMGTVLALLLISTVSAMTLAGPRVLQVVGEDFPLFRSLAKTNADGLPARAVYVQSALAMAFILTGSFESILIFAGFTLGLNSFMAVAGAFLLRWRQPERPRPYRIPLYPLPPLIYLGLTGWTMVYLLQAQTREALLGLAIVALGLVVYAVARRFNPVFTAGDSETAP